MSYKKTLNYENYQTKNIAIPLTLNYGRDFTKPCMIIKSYLNQKGESFRKEKLCNSMN